MLKQKLLLASGMVASASFIIMSVIDGNTRQGYKAYFNTISELSLGSRAWGGVNMPLKKLYLDTSIISHLDASDAPDKMRDTMKLWEYFIENKYDIFLSNVTLNEIIDCNETKKTFMLEKIKQQDPQIAEAVKNELKRQQNVLELIPSENFVSLAVLECLGSVLTNKYSEGYPGKRYYGGTENVDVVENLAIERAKQLGVSPGGDIMIHGIRKGFGWLGPLHRLVNWTKGCIAVTNREIEEIWRAVPNGTRIEIRP